MNTLSMVRPDDWHLHVRNGAMLRTVLPFTVRQFGRAIIMPNLQPPITTVDAALVYRQEILQAVPKGMDFIPLMTLYLTATMTEAEIQKAAACEHIYAVKLYPAGATTHSDAGIGDIEATYPILAAMERHDLPLLVHGEATDPKCDIFDREKAFLDNSLVKIIDRFPSLRIVVEHITTKDAVDFVCAAGSLVAATITPQHLMYNRNTLLAGGIRPHHYCLPILKREHHREALVNAAISGNTKFFLGTDSAPHLTSLKESACGCAGCFSAHAALEFYAAIFEEADALHKLEQFASFNGPDFYRLPRNKDTIQLHKQPWVVPSVYEGAGKVAITPLKAGESLAWQLAAAD